MGQWWSETNLYAWKKLKDTKAIRGWQGGAFLFGRGTEASDG